MSQLVLDDQLDVQIILPGLETWITAVRLQDRRPVLRHACSKRRCVATAAPTEKSSVI